jgi:antitoxin component of MazEF toxin-antitoxin module
MILVYNHKIGRKGMHSLDVILPAIWVKAVNLMPGDKVRIEILESGQLLIGASQK